MELKVKILYDDSYEGFKKGNTGYIDGYIYTTKPCAIVVLTKKIVLVNVSGLRVLR